MSGPGEHPDANALAELVQGLLGDARAAEVEDHLDVCDECRRLVANLARHSDATVRLTRSDLPGRRARALERGNIVGRFTVLEQVGAGGMGVVYAAYDPELDRKIALKLLHTDSPEAAPRLLREAQSLARLSHPNVVAIYDVGTFEGRVFLAMEFVEGEQLGKWLERPRTWQEIRSVFLAAGRGLAAAHRAGLVHRDVKPANMIVGADGRVRVTDFGLAREVAASDAPPQASIAAPDATHTGALLGTPAYMAPEQLRRAPADARSDQFAFCVALHEALYGKRPFSGSTLTELLDSIDSHTRRPPPRRAASWVPRRPGHVPAWLGRVVARGLSPRPEDRFASMDLLLQSLARDPWIVRRRVAGATLAACAIAAVAVFAWRSQPVSCEGAERKIAGVWDAARKQAVRERFAASRLPYADASWKTVERALDGFVTDWVRGHEDACESSARGEQSPDMLDRRMACLLEERAALSAIVHGLANAEPAAVEQSTTTVARLSVARCADIGLLAAVAPRPASAELRARVDAIDAEIARANTLLDAGKGEDARALADSAWQAARPLKWKPLEGRALLARGMAEADLGRAEDAAKSLKAAALAADAGADDRLRAEVGVGMLTLLDQLGTSENAEEWRAATEALVERSRDQALVGRLERGLGIAERVSGRFAEAEEHFRRSHELFARVDPASAETAEALASLAASLHDQGKAQEALEPARTALAAAETTSGTGHPLTANRMGLVAAILADLGEVDAAVEQYRKAIAVLDAVRGPGNLDSAAQRMNLGVAYIRDGRDREALPELKAALAAMEVALAPDHVDIAYCRHTLAGALVNLGRPLEAVPEFRRVAESVSRSSPDHPLIAYARTGAGAALSLAGRKREALTELAAAIAHVERTSGAESADLVYPLVNLGECQLSLQDPAAALAAYERALALVKEPAMTDQARFGVARALAASGGDLARARQLAWEARAGFAGRGQDDGVAEIDRWLAKQPSS